MSPLKNDKPYGTLAGTGSFGDFIFLYRTIIIPMKELNYEEMGGTMKLGLKKSIINKKSSLAYKIYNSLIIFERHRHRYEVNPKYKDIIEKNNLYFSGKDETGNCMDIV